MHHHLDLSPRHVSAADGAQLAYRISGPEDAPALLFSNGYATTAFYWRHVLDHYQHRARLISWDLPGHGDSEPCRDLSTLTIARCAQDIGRILDHAGVERATLLGFSFGCQVTLEAWRHLPSRINALIPVLGTFEHPFHHAFSPFGPLLFQLFKRLAKPLSKPGLGLVAAASEHPMSFILARAVGQVEPGIPYEHFKPFFTHFQQLDPHTWASLGVAAQAHSARDLLPTIHVPSLIISGGKDEWTPAHVSQHMHQAIPGAKHLHIPTAGHTGLLGHAHIILPRLDAFLDAHSLVLPER
jgi:pimeloyl-ACP methyl ester carboxylesterase